MNRCHVRAGSDGEQAERLAVRPSPINDVVVFLRDMRDRDEEVTRIVEVETDILYNIGATINALPFPAGAYRELAGFMSELRKDGVDL